MGPVNPHLAWIGSPRACQNWRRLSGSQNCPLVGRGRGGGVVVVEEAVFKTGYLGIFPGKGQVT